MFAGDEQNRTAKELLPPEKKRRTEVDWQKIDNPYVKQEGHSKAIGNPWRTHAPKRLDEKNDNMVRHH